MTYLKTLPVIVANGLHPAKINALQDTGSDSTLATSELAKQLNLKSISQKLKISSVISTAKTKPQKLVIFSVSSNHSPEKMKIENAWVIENLNLPSVKVSKEDIQNKWEHLKESSIEMLNLNISLIVGADMSHQHISLDLSSEDNNDQIGVSSKLSWVIMKGKSIVHRTVQVIQ